MKTTAIVKALAVCLCAALPVLGHAAGDPGRGEALASNCVGCHAIPGYTNVYPTYSVPKLAGQKAQYLVAALKAYKNGQRTHATMQAQAGSLTEQEMQDLAAYFAGAAPQ